MRVSFTSLRVLRAFSVFSVVKNPRITVTTLGPAGLLLAALGGLFAATLTDLGQILLPVPPSVIATIADRPPRPHFH